MLVYVCLYVKYNNSCSTVSKLIVSKTDYRFDRVLLLILKIDEWQKKLIVIHGVHRQDILDRGSLSMVLWDNLDRDPFSRWSQLRILWPQAPWTRAPFQRTVCDTLAASTLDKRFLPKVLVDKNTLAAGTLDRGISAQGACRQRRSWQGVPDQGAFGQ